MYIRFLMRVCFSFNYANYTLSLIMRILKIYNLEYKTWREGRDAAYPHSLRAYSIYISSTQAIVRQMRAQIGRSVSPSCGSPATYVQLRPISSDLEKCREIMAYVCRSRVDRDRRSRRSYIQMSTIYPKLFRLRWKFILKISIWLIDTLIKRRMRNVYSDYTSV